MMLWLLACGTPTPPERTIDNPFHDAPPRIQTLSAECVPEEGEWIFDVLTQHWTGGGWVWMGTAANNAEGHRLRSVSAAADGSTDALRLTLDIAADWRDAARNSSTRFLCADRPRMSFLVTAYDARGEGVEDCRTWGHDPALWLSVDAAHNCETEWVTEADTGDLASD